MTYTSLNTDLSCTERLRNINVNDSKQGPNMRSKRHQKLKRRHLFFLGFLFCSILCVFYYRFQLDDKLTPFLADDVVTNFLINTPGCQIPAWDPWDDSVKPLFKEVTPYKCSGLPSFLRVLPNAVVTVEDAILEFYYEVLSRNVSCLYQEIRRNTTVSDLNVDNRVSFSRPTTLTFDKPVEVDFMKTTCKLADKEDLFEEFLPLTPLKRDVEKRCVDRSTKIRVKRPLNVIFLGLDSISHLNFRRHFPKCAKYLSNHLQPVTLDGYTKVGDNTFPNIVPLLTGHFYKYYYDEIHNTTMFFDDLEFSWKAYAELGYRTLLAEDAPEIATFNYFRNGFKNPPTDYYYRPLALAMENSELRKKSKGQCIGHKMEMGLIYDYLKSFTDTMGQNRPFFAFLFLARLTHDVFNFAGYADEPTYQLLKYLDDTQVLDNSLLVFYSDHGLRYGPIRKTRIGQYEERMPFMHLVFPKWFLDEHESIRKNLNINSKRLTTPFDIHATILHLAGLTAGAPSFRFNLKPGKSLFNEIPANRTCAETGISPHWCTCQVSKPISKDLPIVHRVAEAVIFALNKRTKIYRDRCSVLSLDEILDARITDGSSVPTKNSTPNEKTFENYLIVISASPSNAIFEATVRCRNSGSCQVIDDISRINEYGKQSDCISDTVVKKFCYCA